MSDDDLVKAQTTPPDQLKAARALLGWTRLQLALRSATSEHIVSRYEKRGQVAGRYGQPELGAILLPPSVPPWKQPALNSLIETRRGCGCDRVTHNVASLPFVLSASPN